MKKTQKMLIGMCSGAVALGAVVGISCLALNLANKKAPAKQGDLDISYDAGTGSFVNNKNTNIKAFVGTRFDALPKPVAQLPGKVFAGWKDATSSSSGILKGNQIINSNMKLVATYNDVSSEFATVKFVAGIDETQKKEVILLGNPVVSVMKNYLFLMVNRPSATWEVKGVTKYFKGWKYAENTGTHKKGDYIKESDSITGNITLYPEFSTSVTVNWIVDTNQPGQIDRGSNYTTLEEGTEFNQFNQPGISCTTASASYYFEGWYKSYDSATGEFGEKWNKTDIVKSTGGVYNVNAYARWVIQPAPSTDYVTLSYVENELVTETVGTQTFYPSKYGVIKKGTTWGNATKPNVKTGSADYKLAEDEEAAWQYRTSEYDVWKALTSDVELTDNIEIRPLFQQAIDSVSILLDDDAKVQQESEQTMQAAVVGGDTKTVTWALYADAEGKTPLSADIAVIDSTTGKLTVKAINPDSTLQTSFYIQATSTVDTSIKSNLDYVRIAMPYDDNQDIWFYSTSGASGEGHWYSMNVDALCSESTVTATPLKNAGVDPLTVKPTDSFANTLHFGSDLLSIKSNFLSGWTGFNAKIDFTNANVTHIFSNFLAGCTSFNQQMDLSKIKYIGNGFLYGCTSYDQPISFGSETNAKPVLYEIGDDFLGDCQNFNSTITLPETLLSINNDFLFNCKSFNQDLTLPHSLQYVGSFFMSQCNAFTSTLNVNFDTSIGTTKEVFACNESDLATITSSEPISSEGFAVGGDQAEDFKTYYKTQQQFEYAFRRIKGTTWDGQLPDLDTMKASLSKLSKATSFHCDYNYGDGKEIVNLDYNNDSGYKTKIIAKQKGGETETTYEFAAEGQNGLLDVTDGNGAILDLRNPNYTRVSEIREMTANIGQLMTSGKTLPDFVKVPGGVGYYTVSPTEYSTANIYFDENYNVSRAVVYTYGYVYTDIQFSNIGKTTVTTPTVTNKYTLNWDATGRKFTKSSIALKADTTHVFLAKLSGLTAEELNSFKGKFQMLNSGTPVVFDTDQIQVQKVNIDADAEGTESSVVDRNTYYFSPYTDSETGKNTWTQNDIVVITAKPLSAVANATINLDITHTDSLYSGYSNMYFREDAALQEGDSVTITESNQTGTIVRGGEEESFSTWRTDVAGKDHTITFKHNWDGGCYVDPEESFVYWRSGSTDKRLTFNEMLQSGKMTLVEPTAKGNTGTITIDKSFIPTGTDTLEVVFGVGRTAFATQKHPITTNFTTVSGKVESVVLVNPDGSETTMQAAGTYNQYGTSKLDIKYSNISTTTGENYTIDGENSTITVDGTAMTINSFAQTYGATIRAEISIAYQGGEDGHLQIFEDGGTSGFWADHTISAINLVFKVA